MIRFGMIAALVMGVSVANGNAFAKTTLGSSLPLKTNLSTSTNGNVKTPVSAPAPAVNVPVSAPEQTQISLDQLKVEAKRLINLGMANIVIASQGDIDTINDSAQCPKCRDIIARFREYAKSGKLPEEGLLLAAIDPQNPLLLTVIGQVDPQLASDLPQVPANARPTLTLGGAIGSVSMNVQIGVNPTSGLPQVTGASMGQVNSSRDALRAGLGLEFLRQSSSSGATSQSETGLVTRNPFVHAEDEPQNVNQIVTSGNETTTNAQVDDVEIVTTQTTGGRSTIVIQPKEVSVLSEWGNAIRNLLFGERKPEVERTVARDEDPNAPVPRSPEELGLKAPQTFLDLVNLRFSGVIDDGDRNDASKNSLTSAQSVESPDGRVTPVITNLKTPTTALQAGQQRLGSVTMPAEGETVGSSTGSGSVDLSRINFCNPTVSADGAANPTCQ